MSTIVIVKKNGKACIAADTLTTFGDLRLGSDMDVAHDKVQSYGDGYLGIVGSAAHALVIESIITHKKLEIDFSNRMNIFETFREMHPIVKDKYFLNAKDEDDDPYEASHIDALICNAKGIFGVYSLREVSEYTQYWAIGSGADFALGAMHAMYDRLDSAEEIARAGVEAGSKFNSSSDMPMTSYTIELDD